MNPFYLAWLLIATVAAIDVLEVQKELPKCSLVCVVEGISQHNCTLDDFECQCNKIEDIVKTVSPCLVRAGCNLQNITAVGQIVLKVCKTLPGANETVAGAANNTKSGADAVRYGVGLGGVVGAVLLSVFL